MSEEEKKAMKYLKFNIDKREKGINYFIDYTEEYKNQKVLLNLIEKQQKENEKIRDKLDIAEKIIEEMAKRIVQAYFDEEAFEKWIINELILSEEPITFGYLDERVKEYFKNKRKDNK